MRIVFPRLIVVYYILYEYYDDNINVQLTLSRQFSFSTGYTVFLHLAHGGFILIKNETKYHSSLEDQTRLRSLPISHKISRKKVQCLQC